MNKLKILLPIIIVYGGLYGLFSISSEFFFLIDMAVVGRFSLFGATGVLVFPGFISILGILALISIFISRKPSFKKMILFSVLMVIFQFFVFIILGNLFPWILFN